MVKAIIELRDREDQILNIVKGKYGFKNKSDAINFVVGQFEKQLGPGIRPEVLKKPKKQKQSEEEDSRTFY